MVLLLNGGKLGHPDGFCFYCGRPIWKSKSHPYTEHSFTRDHVIPKSKGGKHTVPACLGCNWDKVCLSLEEYMIVLAFRNGVINLPEDYKVRAAEAQ